MNWFKLNYPIFRQGKIVFIIIIILCLVLIFISALAGRLSRKSKFHVPTTLLSIVADLNNDVVTLFSIFVWFTILSVLFPGLVELCKQPTYNWYKHQPHIP